jgi:2',3'-cyclic-nucleotide 2'-phosphodiesterase (5'-nucleotidase family)
MRIQPDNSQNAQFKSTGSGIDHRDKAIVKEPVDNYFHGETLQLKVAGKFTILHTNDMHGHAESFMKKNGEESSEVGGIANIASLIESEKAKNPKSTIILDAGDISSGTPLSDQFSAMPMLESMNEIGYDAMTVGNHEFDKGRESLENLVKNADFPILGANISSVNGGNKLDTKPYVIRNINGIRVGILGLTTLDAAKYMSAKDKETIKIADPIRTAKSEIGRMKKEGAEFIVVLSHLGDKEDRRLAKAAKGINVIVGGHSHTEMRSYQKVDNTYIVQAGSDGQNLGRLDMILLKDKHGVEINNLKASLIRVKGEKVKPDPVVSGIVDKYKEKLGPILNRVIGTTAVDLKQDDYHTIKENSNIANFVTDAIRQKTGADISVLAYSTIRAGIPKGEIKVEDIYKVIPWDDPLNTVKIQGKNLKSMMERGFKNDMLEFCQSGLKIRYDVNRPPGDRITELTEAGGKPIDPEKTYSVVTRSFLIDSPFASEAFVSAQDRKVVKEEFQNLLISHIETAGKLYARLDDRMQSVA